MIAAIELRDGTTIQSHTYDDPDEQQQPIIVDNEGFDESKLLERMKTEATQMKLHKVYEEVDIENSRPLGPQRGTQWHALDEAP